MVAFSIILISLDADLPLLRAVGLFQLIANKGGICDYFYRAVSMSSTEDEKLGRFMLEKMNKKSILCSEIANTDLSGIQLNT